VPLLSGPPHASWAGQRSISPQNSRNLALNLLAPGRCACTLGRRLIKRWVISSAYRYAGAWNAASYTGHVLLADTVAYEDNTAPTTRLPSHIGTKSHHTSRKTTVCNTMPTPLDRALNQKVRPSSAYARNPNPISYPQETSSSNP
jgi:hypothetical protein